MTALFQGQLAEGRVDLRARRVAQRRRDRGGAAQRHTDDIDAWFDRIETHHPGPREALESYFDIVHRHGGLLAAISRDPGALEAGDTIAHVAGWRERVQTVLADRDASFAERVRTTVAIVGLARTASLFPSAQVDELRAIAVAAALRALQSD